MDRNLPDRRITVAGRAFQAGGVKVGRPRGCPGESQGVEWGEAGPKSAGKGAANSKRRSGEVGRRQIVRSPDLAGREWGLYSVGAEGEAGRSWELLSSGVTERSCQDEERCKEGEPPSPLNIGSVCLLLVQ